MFHGINFNSVTNLTLNTVATATGPGALVTTAAARDLATKAFTNAVTDKFGPDAGNLASASFRDAFGSNFQGVDGWDSEPLTSAANAVIDAANHQGANGAYTGDADRAGNDLQDAFSKAINDEALARAMKSGSDKESDGPADSWLVAIAKAMGKMLGNQAQHLVDLTNEMAKHTGKNDAQEFQQINAEFSAQSQMFGILSNSFSNSIKTIGDGLTTIARKN